MNKFRVGMPVYHYMQMNKIGTIVAIEDVPVSQMLYSTEGSPSVARKARVRYEDGSEVLHRFSDLMRADLDQCKTTPCVLEYTYDKRKVEACCKEETEALF